MPTALKGLLLIFVCIPADCLDLLYGQHNVAERYVLCKH